MGCPPALTLDKFLKLGVELAKLGWIGQPSGHLPQAFLRDVSSFKFGAHQVTVRSKRVSLMPSLRLQKVYSVRTLWPRTPPQRTGSGAGSMRPLFSSQTCFRIASVGNSERALTRN
jgi:hypothetical protein